MTSVSVPNFEALVDPALRGGLETLRASDVAPSVRPDILARIRGIAIGTLSEATGGSGEAAAGIEEMQDYLLPRPEGGEPLAVRVFQPERFAPGGPAILYIHGGGMIRGSVLREQAGAVRLAIATVAKVVSVEYRLAPEHPYPAAADDCYQALLWVHDNAGTLQIDTGRVAVCGGSAGGGLAAATALMARDRNGPQICFQILSSPMLDDRTVQRSLPEFEGIPGWNAEMNRFAWNCLLPGMAGTPEVPSYAAPGRATDLSGLPPAYLSIGQLEIFRDEGLAFAAGLTRYGVPVELHMYPRAYHGWEPLNPHAEVSQRTRMARERAACAALAGADKGVTSKSIGKDWPK